MRSTTNTKGMQRPTSTTTAGGENRRDAQRRHRIEVVLWILGFILFVAACFIIHSHQKPYSFELATTEAAQGLHLSSLVINVIEFPSALNQPIPSAVALAAWILGLLIIGLIVRLRQHPAVLWFQSAIFILVAVMSSAGINVLVDDIVGRPRPSPKDGPIHVHDLVPFPSFPSGHTEHDIAYYGFLLYLSFTKPVREWRYRWVLLPFQLYAVYDIVSIGFSRVYEGDHWLLDVLGGYLEGILLLFIFIFLYRWVTAKLEERREKKQGLNSSIALGRR